MHTHAEFLAAVERYLEVAGVAPTKFGATHFNDPNFVRELRKGRSPTLTIVGRVMEIIEAHKPGPRTEKAA